MHPYIRVASVYERFFGAKGGGPPLIPPTEASNQAREPRSFIFAVTMKFRPKEASQISHIFHAQRETIQRRFEPIHNLWRRRPRTLDGDIMKMMKSYVLNRRARVKEEIRRIENRVWKLQTELAELDSMESLSRKIKLRTGFEVSVLDATDEQTARH